MKTYIFETKENYLNMKQTWATYFNTEARNLERNEYGNKIRKLTATHFALYAILRGKDPMKALSTASLDTIMNIKYDVQLAHTARYNGWCEKWQKFFNITEDEAQKMIEIAYDIFEKHKKFKKIKKEKIPISEEQLFNCLA